MSHLSSKTRSALFWSTGGGILSNAVQLAFVAILARLLTPADFGVYAAALVFISFLQVFAEAGVGPALIQRKDLSPRHIRTASALSLGLFTGVGLVLILLAPLCGRAFDMPQLVGPIRLLALWLPMRGISIVPESLLLRGMRFDVYAAVQLASYVVGFGLTSISLALAGLGYWALVAASFAQMSLYAGGVAWICRRDLGLGFGRREAGDLLHYGIGNSLATMAAFFADQGSQIVSAKCLGPASLGLFSRAYQLLVSPAKLIGNTVSKAIFPALSKIQDQPERMAGIVCGGLSLTGIISVPASVIAILFARDIVYLLLGPDWLAAVPAFRILVVSLVFRSGYRLFDTVAKAVGAVYGRAWRHFWYAAAVIGLAMWGSRYGIEHIALGNTLAILLNFVLMMQLCSVHLRTGLVRWVAPLRGGAVLGFAVGVAEVPLYLLALRWPLPSWLVLGLAAAVAGLVVVLVWIKANGWLLGPDGIEVLRRMLPPRLAGRLTLLPVDIVNQENSR